MIPRLEAGTGKLAAGRRDGLARGRSERPAHDLEALDLRRGRVHVQRNEEIAVAGVRGGGAPVRGKSLVGVAGQHDGGLAVLLERRPDGARQLQRQVRFAKALDRGAGIFAAVPWIQHHAGGALIF